MAKEMETLREVRIFPMLVQRMSSHPAAKGLLTTWMWKVVAITAFLLASLHMLPEVFHLHFSHFSMVLAADIQKSWTNGCGKHTNWLQQRACREQARSCRSSMLHVHLHSTCAPGLRHGSWGGTRSLTTQLFLWSRLKCGCHEKICFGVILD